MGERFCSSCGNRISGDGRFCSFCGAVITPAPAQAPADELGATVAVFVDEPVYQANSQPVREEPVYQQPQQPVYQQPQAAYQQPQQPVYQQPAYQQSYAAPARQPVRQAAQPAQPVKRKKKTGLIVGLSIGGVVAVALIAAVLVFALTPSDSNTGIFENICKGNLFGGGEGIDHSYAEATCEVPETCEYCEATLGKAKGHDWVDATCETPKICAECGEEKGSPLGHSWTEATYTDPQVCSVCDLVGEPSITVQRICGEWDVIAYSLGDGVQPGRELGYTLEINPDGTGRLNYADDALIFDWEFFELQDEDIICEAVVSNRNNAVVLFGLVNDKSEETYDHIIFIATDTLTLLFERA